MKVLEIFFRLLDKLIKSIELKKAQDARNDLEKNPADWFDDHFNGVSSDKSNKTN
jgi:hypothetical protein